MNVSETMLAGVLLIEPRVFADERGFFKETYNAARYRDQAKIELPFIQDNHSHSVKNVVRGLHFQKTRPQGKLVSVSSGVICDVVVDIRLESPNFGRHLAIEISAVNQRQLWIPPGYAHGYCVVSDIAEVHYKCTDYYFPDDEAGIIWNCPELAIRWPVTDPIVSKKDAQLPRLSQWRNQKQRGLS